MSNSRGHTEPGSQSLRLGSSQLMSLEMGIVEATGGGLTATCSPHLENFVVQVPFTAVAMSSTGKVAPTAAKVIVLGRFVVELVAPVVHFRTNR